MEHPFVSGAQLAQKALTVARGFAASHLTEATGHNDGAEIDKIESIFGLKGAPYCAMGAVFCYAKAYAFLAGIETSIENLKNIVHFSLPHYFEPSPSCMEMMVGAHKRDLWREVIHAPGDMAIFTFGKYLPNGAPAPEHIGIVADLDAGITPRSGNIHCIEFNTGPGSGGNQADGQGVYLRSRPVSQVMGYIHVNDS